MKKSTYLCFLFVLSIFSLSAQTKDTTTNKETTEKIILATYKDGENGAALFIMRNLVYPVEALQRNIQGRFSVEFTIDEKGNLSEFSTDVYAHDLLKTEAFRVIKLMKGWKPATKNGLPVKSRRSLPVGFTLR